jgi:hypothetical protein
MTEEPFLIAHKVRGEEAFDVAIQMECPECHGNGCCNECEDKGYWWIIPTSGHRAYPYFSAELPEDFVCSVPEMPQGLQDHYKVGPAPKVDIKSLFKRVVSDPKSFIPRRF